MIKKILLLSLVIIAIVAVYGLYSFNKTVPSLSKVKADFSLNAEDLFAEFDANEEMANNKYLGKVISVEGTVLDLNEKDGLRMVNLDSGSDFGMISCKLDSTIKNIDVERGSQIQLKCQCTGYLMDVVMNRCVIEKNK